jgi:GT2 family glycosyltransferase
LGACEQPYLFRAEEGAMESPLLSVIILNYNYSRFLSASINSALGQDWPNREIIVVDDCSTDDSRAIIASFGAQVIPVLQPQNRGHGAGMNAGFARSKGDIIIFLDADDCLYPKALRRIAERQSPNATQYQYRLDLVDEAGQVLDTYPPKEFVWEDGDVTSALLARGRYSTTVTSGLAFSRSVLDRIMPMDEQAFRQGGDGYLATVAPLYGLVVTIDEVLGAYRQHGANHSQFGGALDKSVRWRITHDILRYQALTTHAQRLGKEPLPDPWQNDPLHLEGRMASLLLNPAEHPDARDTRKTIARRGLAACHSLPMSRKRREFMMLWWNIVGWGPLPLARAALRWKLQADSRPLFVKRLAKLVRLATG